MWTHPRIPEVLHGDGGVVQDERKQDEPVVQPRHRGRCNRNRCLDGRRRHRCLHSPRRLCISRQCRVLRHVSRGFCPGSTHDPLWRGLRRLHHLRVRQPICPAKPVTISARSTPSAVPPADRASSTVASTRLVQATSSASFSRTCSACPAAFTVAQWWATLPAGSMSTVDRITPMVFLP